MGNSLPEKIQYKTKDGYHISYYNFDLKNKSRFPSVPEEAVVNVMFENCLSQIEISQLQKNQIKEFNTKYRHRFVILHKKKLQEAKQTQELEKFRRSSTLSPQKFQPQTKEKSKTQQLQEMMKDVQLNETVIKVALLKIQKFIAEKLAQNQFIQMKGMQRLLELLDKAITLNESSTKTNFSNQIQLLKFIKQFSDRFPKEFYSYLPKIKNFGYIIFKTYHPVNTQVTAYCLNLLADYVWRVQEGDQIIKILQKFRFSHGYSSFLTPFIDTIEQSDNILMVCYNLRFINELLAAVIEQDQKQILKQNLSQVKYNFVLQNIKFKLEEGFYVLENTTFITVHQKIFKYVTKNKNQKKNVQQNRMVGRQTMNLNVLHEQLMMSFIESSNLLQNNQEQEKDNSNILVCYLGQSDRKQFNKFILQTLTELQKYSKLQLYLDGTNADNENVETHQLAENKLNGQNLDSYYTRIKQSCVKNSCNQLLANCFKNLQYFQKSQWKHLDSFILEQLGLGNKVNEEIEALKKNLEQKQSMVKKIIKYNLDLKNQISQLKDKEGTQSQRTNKLSSDVSDFLDQKKADTTFVLQDVRKSKLPMFKKTQVLQLPASLSNFLPGKTLPPPPNKQLGAQTQRKNLIHEKPQRDYPRLSFISELFKLKIAGVQSKSNTNNSNSILPNLPPPPSLGNSLPNLPPPPSLGNSLPNLPPPPSLGNSLPNLPPPPSLGNSLPNLPPPPSLGNSLSNLPPPPSLGGLIGNLPPPPSLGNLPPPPSLGNSLNLPPPPSLGLSNLPPPPSMVGMSLPPPPSLGNLPSIGGLMPPPLLGGLGLPNIPLIGNPMNQFDTKQKEKKKPSVQLKACNYTVLPYQKIVQTIWEEIDDQKIKLDQKEIQQIFCKNVQTNNLQFKVKSQILTSIQQKKEQVKLLGSDRWRNVQIVLTKLKVPTGEMSKALRQCTGKFATTSALQSISKMLPSEQQQQLIKMYEGDINDLGKPQRFFKELFEVPEYSHRIKTIIFSGIKQEFYYQLSSKIEQLQGSFTALKDNYRLQYILQVCLALGNYLNGTNLKGGAWGFKLQTIDRLEQVKSKDNQMNAAFYLIRQVWKKYPYAIFQKEQLNMYQYISKMPLSQISAQLTQLKKYSISVKKAYESAVKTDPNDNIGAYCQQMLMEIQNKLEQYTNLNQKLKQSYLELAKYYCQDGSKLASDQFGKKIWKCLLFISNTQKMYKVVDDRIKKEESRKAIKNQVSYNQNPQSQKKQIKPAQTKISSSVNNLPKPPTIPNNLPKPPINMQVSKEQKLKQMQKIQQQRQKKALEEVMMKRTSKINAFRMSKITMSQKNNLEQISFLKGLN